MMIQEILREKFASNPNHIGFRTYESAWTYNEIWTESWKIATYLKNKRVVKGSHVGLYFDNDPWFVISMFGIFLAQGVAVPIPYYSKKQEVDSIITKCNVSICLCGSKQPIGIKRDLQCINILTLHTLEFDGLSFIEECNHDDSKTAMLLTTSGSTGDPKIIALSHLNISCNSIAHAKCVNYSNKDRFLITMPIHFSSVITTQIISCIFLNCEVYFEKIPILPKRLFSILNNSSITCLATVPTILRLLLTTNTNVDIYPQVHTMIISGAAFDKSLMELAKKTFPNVDFLQTYGLTEASPRVSIMNRTDNEISCGTAVEGVTLKIVDESGREVPRLEHGEILVKGSNVMKFYYKDQYNTDLVIKNNWLYTGDLGYLDTQNRLHLVGRKKNIIIVGGQNVYPEEVEQFIQSIPSVREVAIIGGMDRLLGEIPIAFLVGDSTLSIDVLNKLCTEGLSNYKIPKKWYFISEIPKTKNGKYDRNALRHLI